MNVPTTPEKLKELAAAYVLGDLDPEEAEKFKQFLAENSELIEEVNGLQETLGEVLEALTKVEPPPYLRSAILEAANNLTNYTPTPASKRFSLRWSQIAGTIAALLVVVLGWDNYRLRQELSISKNLSAILQNSQTRLFFLKGMDAANTSSGSIIMNPEQRKVVVFIRNLPAPPGGKVYRLWALVDGEKIPCGQVSASPQGMVLDKLSIPSDLYSEISGLIVTLESSLATSDPVGTVVMKSSL